MNPETKRKAAGIGGVSTGALALWLIEYNTGVEIPTTVTAVITGVVVVFANFLGDVFEIMGEAILRKLRSGLLGESPARTTPGRTSPL